MSTDRAIHHDEGFGDALRRRVDIVDEIPRLAEGQHDHDSRRDLPTDLPEVGSEAFRALNRRRVELIEKAIAGPLTGAERDELERLEKICSTVLNHAFPLLPIDLDALVRHRENPRTEEEGRGA